MKIFKTIYKLQSSYLQYCGVISNITSLRKTIKLDQDAEKNENKNSTKDLLALSKFYRKLVTKKAYFQKEVKINGKKIATF